LYYDKKVLDSLRDAPIRCLHICSTEFENPQQDGGLMMDGWFNKYPVDAINWWNHSFAPCSQTKRVYGDRFCVVAGVDHKHTMRYGTPIQVDEQVRASIHRMGEDGGFIIGPGCTLFQDTPLEHFNAVARAVEKYGTYRR
jgi:uroporphyrinogen-III decarboxylase